MRAKINKKGFMGRFLSVVNAEKGQKTKSIGEWREGDITAAVGIKKSSYLERLSFEVRMISWLVGVFLHDERRIGAAEAEAVGHKAVDVYVVHAFFNDGSALCAFIQVIDVR